MKKPTKAVLNKIDMSPILDNIPENDTNRIYIDAKAGEEHYRLLVWLGKKVKGRIIELGTFRGHGSLCFSIGSIGVQSFDVINNLSIINIPENVEFLIRENGYDWADEDVDLIFIDTMHDGIYERKVLDHLWSINWKGIVVMDDIVLFPELAKLWEEIPERKEDWTDIGHHSGTGVIYFE